MDPRHLKHTILFIVVLLVLACPNIQAQLTADFKLKKPSDTSFCFPSPPIEFQYVGEGSPTTFKWDFGNGIGYSVERNPGYTYSAPGVFTVILIVSNGAESDTNSMVIKGYEKPATDFEADDIEICKGSAVEFSDLTISGSSIKTWKWDFDDGVLITQNKTGDTTHTYNISGTFSPSLEVTDIHGCKNSLRKTNYIKVSEGPSADFSGGPYAACEAPKTFDFTDNTTGGAGTISYQWAFGDGKYSTEQHPSNNYTNLGLYDVRLIATDGFGCADTVVKKEYVALAEVKNDLSEIPDKVCTKSTFVFNNDVPSGVTTRWTFNDGTGTFVGNTVLHSFPDTGSFEIRVVSKSGNCSDTSYKTIEAYELNAGFEADTTESCSLPFAVNFSDRSQPGGNIVKWLWEFGDNTVDSSFNPVHNYTSEGTYNVSLTVSDENGCSKKFSRNEYISIVPPKAEITSDRIKGCYPLPVQFSADKSFSREPLSGYEWHFGNGSSSTEVNPANTYQNEGDFIATLTITNEKGCTDTDTLIIRAGEKPKINFGVDTNKQCTKMTFQFADSTQGNVDEWLWFFGDGGSSAEQHPPYQYTSDTGYMNVMLIAGNRGCLDTLTKDSFVFIPPPVALYTEEKNCDNVFERNFIEDSKGAHSWFWDFGDGGVSFKQQPPVHTFPFKGDFTVTLVVTNDTSGCKDTVYTTIKIREPEAIIKPIDTACAPSARILDGSGTDFGIKDYEGENHFEWNFGDGQTQKDFYSNDKTIVTPKHIYSTAGSYTASLIATDINGCKDTAYQNVVLEAPPVAGFSATTSGGCAPLTVTFTDSSTSDREITAKWWFFGDGRTDLGNNSKPNHTFWSPGSYYPTLIIQNSLGCTDTFNLKKEINATTVTAAFTIKDAICIGDSVSVQDASIGNVTSWNWDFGDGTTDTSETPSAHLYNKAGWFPVNLTVTDHNGCKGTTSKVLNVQDPKPGFTPGFVNVACPPVAVNFTDTTKGNIEKWLWNFGDGGTSNLQNPGHNYTTPGNYNVILTVTSTAGCVRSDTVFDFVKVKGAAAKVTAAPTDGCKNLEVTFTLSDTSELKSYTWDFGNGVTRSDSSELSASYTYRNTGQYATGIFLEDFSGCKYYLPVNMINVHEVAADFTVDFPKGCAPFPAQFTDASYPKIKEWVWLFGDGDSSHQQHPRHLYQKGTYNVSLAVTDSNGCSDTITKQGVVFVPGIQASVTASPEQACEPSTVNFKPASVADTTIKSWTWDFGDQTVPVTYNTPSDPDHLFQQAGNYTTTLIIEDHFGCKDTTDFNITVNPKPQAAFTPPDPICINNEVSFVNTSRPLNESSFLWLFENGETSEETHPKFIYKTPGQKSVTLIVISKEGCADTLTNANSIKVHNNPVIQVSPDTTIYIGKTASLYAAGPAIRSWQWSPPDHLNKTKISNPEASPPVTTEYTVTATDTNGCTTDATVLVRINGEPTVLVPNGFTPNNDGKNDFFKAINVGMEELFFFKVYNRWGNLIWEANDFDDGWDGTYKGVPQEVDVYVYHLEGKSMRGNIVKIKGNVTLIR